MTATTSSRIIVGLSGGVDSSVSALLLKQQGYEVHGLFMKNWEEDDTDDYCSAATDLEDASRVCDRLDIPLHTVNFSTEYWDRVFRSFLDEYRAGHTPNPDILCNREIKFRAFLHHAQKLGGDRIATGHYARIDSSSGAYRLLRAKDTNKDQTYFLHTLTQDQLASALFPIGGLTKDQVRRIAAEFRFENHDKKDSTGICFIGERNFRQFLQKYLPVQPGNIESEDGTVIGRHDGLMYYTLGQRQGLGIGGRREGSGEPWFVAAKDMNRNVLVAVQGHDHPLLFHDSLVAREIHWIRDLAPPLPCHCSARIRYRQPVQECEVIPYDDGCFRVQFRHPQRAIAPGQAVVFYLGEECLGGGIIDRIENSDPRTP